MDILGEAKKIVTGERAKNYGKVEDNFSDIAALWSKYLKVNINTFDVANMMILLKIARAKGNNDYADNYIDIAGYAACAGMLGDDK